MCKALPPLPFDKGLIKKKVIPQIITIGWLQSHSSLHGNLHGFYSAQRTERNQNCECVYATYFNYLCSLYQSHTPELDWAPKSLQMNEDSTRGRMNLHLFGGWNCRVVTRILNVRHLTQLLFPVRVHPSLSSSQEVSFIFTLKKILSLVPNPVELAQVTAAISITADSCKVSMSPLLPQRFIHRLNTSFLHRILHNSRARPERLLELCQAKVAFRV